MIDLNTVGAQTVQALTNLREPGTAKVVELFSSELEETQRKLVRASDTVLIHRLQGRAELLEELLSAVEDARAMARKKRL